MSIAGTGATIFTSFLGINLMKPEDFAPYRMWFTFPGLILVAFVVGFAFDILQDKTKNSKKKWHGNRL